jgi:hypothetical protein
VFTMQDGERFVQLQRTHTGKGVILVDGAEAGFVKAAAAKLIQ